MIPNRFSSKKLTSSNLKQVSFRILSTIVTLLVVSSVPGFAQVAVLDLETMDRVPVRAPGQRTRNVVDLLEQLPLPERPVFDLSAVKSVGIFNVFETADPPSEAFAAYEVPPPVDGDAIDFESSSPVPQTSLPEEVDFLAENCIDQLSGGSCGETNACVEVDSVKFAEKPILMTHRVLEAAYHCGLSLKSPRGNRWIFWKDEYCPAPPRPLRCSLQKRFVNWRHSSVNLQGCLPAGYDMSDFVQTVPNVEFHQTPLAINGPSNSAGTIAEARQIDGEETLSLQAVSINITPPAGELPTDVAQTRFEAIPPQIHLPGSHRTWSGTSFYWNASLLNHQPLYFEDANLERHGFSYGYLQPLVSGAKFFARLPALPYLMAAEAPQETRFTLGESRPGSHACYVCERPPLRFDAAAVEAAAVVGLVFLIP